MRLFLLLISCFFVQNCAILGIYPSLIKVVRLKCFNGMAAVIDNDVVDFGVSYRGIKTFRMADGSEGIYTTDLRCITVDKGKTIK